MTYRDFPFQTARTRDERLPLLQGKTAIVTGAGSGIGRAVALLFAREGANVIVADETSAASEETVAAIESTDGRASFMAGDIADPKYHRGLVTFAKHRYGWLDIAVNNAGNSSASAPLAGIPIETWDKFTAISLSGVFYALRAQIPAMIDAGGGVIVNLVTAAGTGAAPGVGAYTAFMQGLVGLTKGVALEYGQQGIRANAVAPGYVDTQLSTIHSSEGHAKLAAHHAVHHLEQVAEIAQLVLFLASAQSNFINGSCVPMNGGMLVQ
ncbi:SDR family NAD(P)-dependent oxidoreductase [Sphingomonas sp. LaA6.9]|uniref:SDR family NAD(P)-dependent oxidoreductase n=1 Tax=Sphingomonas sp. LaA6.9 TaxID=2919914 RepID=UPI001F4F3899|nr:SDR family oxidoreductase [Sphingomonas sp. LaA6.9]MCJ8159887.1 SDR family oxidoreductase [Sphingomonas sp. LaA6.9]